MPRITIGAKTGDVRAGELLLASAYTTGTVLLVAVVAFNPDLPVEPAVFVGVAYGYALLGGVATAAAVGDVRILCVPAVVVALSVPTTIIAVIVRDPAPDGLGGLAALALAIAPLIGLGAGLGVAEWRGKDPFHSHERA